MNRIITGIFAAALFSASSGVVMAQGMPTQAQANSAAVFRVGHTPDEAKSSYTADLRANMGAAAETNTRTDVSGQTYGSLISSIQSGGVFDPNTIDKKTNIDFVPLSSLKGEGAENAQALDNALSKNADAVGKLRTDLQKNDQLMAKLSDKGYTVDDVIAITTGGEGSVFVYIDDRG